MASVALDLEGGGGGRRRFWAPFGAGSFEYYREKETIVNLEKKKSPRGSDSIEKVTKSPQQQKKFRYEGAVFS